MDIEDLPDDLKEMVKGLKHGSYTIECNVKDALEIASDLDDFRERVSCEIDGLIGEAQEIKDMVSKETVHVVIHLHEGAIFNTAVFKNEDKARKYRDDQAGKHEEMDTIDLQECSVIE